MLVLLALGGTETNNSDKPRKRKAMEAWRKIETERRKGREFKGIDIWVALAPSIACKAQRYLKQTA